MRSPAIRSRRGGRRVASVRAGSVALVLALAALAPALWAAVGCRDGAPRGAAASEAPPAFEWLPFAAAGSGRPGDAPSASAQAAGALAARLCAALHEVPAGRRAACCGAEPPETALAAECTRMLGAALAAGTVSLAADDVARCEVAQEAAHGGCDWVGAWPVPLPTACDGIVRGVLDQEADCRSPIECRWPLACHGLGSAAPGRCGPARAPGAPCGGAVDPLAFYLRQEGIAERHPECEGWCSRGVCAPFRPLGGACRAAAECGSGRHCGPSGCAAGERVPPGGACIGADCGPEARCVDGRCREPAAAGTRCRSDFECRGGCVRAEGDGAADPGTCGPRCDLP